MKAEPRTTDPTRFAAELEAFAFELGPELVPAGWTEAMAFAAERFGRAQPEFAFEVHVAAPEPRVDLTVRVKRPHRNELGEIAELSGPARRFLRAWSDPTSNVAELPFVEFEFDLPGHARDPWIGPAVEPWLRSGPRVIQRERDRRSQQGEPERALAIDVLDMLGDEPLGPATRRRLADAIATLPRWGLIGQVARLDTRPARSREGVRAFASLPRIELRGYLERLDWSGSWASIDGQIEALSPNASWVDLDFGIHQGELEPQLGHYLEFRGPRAQTSALARAVDGLSTRCRAGSLESTRAWLSRVAGRQDRVLTIKHILDGASPFEQPPKLYFSSLRRSAQPSDGRDRVHP